jgi:hypothetical protein
MTQSYFLFLQEQLKGIIHSLHNSAGGVRPSHVQRAPATWARIGVVQDAMP